FFSSIGNCQKPDFKSHRYKFKWGPEQSKSFNDLKQLLTSSPLLLNFPDDTQPVLLSTDASKVGTGGVLYQKINNVKKILYYHSELLSSSSSSQKRYHPIELEAIAIFKCINRMKSFLLGQNIIIYTDNCPICHLMDKHIDNNTVKGKYNCLPDYLSRHPISYDDGLLDSEYGLGFTEDKSSIQLPGAVVTRSQSKATSANVTSPSSTQTPSASSSFPSAVSTHLSYLNQYFDLTKLKEHQNNDIQIQKNY
ncbi:unnamed protein product, partial [Rotaria sp. Silwood2]